MRLILLAFVSYLCGSIPFGLIMGKLVKGVDLRDFGSGNIGATNAGRVLGFRWGLICLVLDAAKGWLPVAILPGLFSESQAAVFGHATILAGTATIIGHMFPCWLGFRGGKGVATSLGVLLVISPWGGLVAAALFFSSLVLWRYVSLSSMIAAVGFGSFELWQLWPTPFSEQTWSRAVFAILVPVMIIIQHRGNIRRLLRGEEPPLSRKNEPAENSPTDRPPE